MRPSTPTARPRECSSSGVTLIEILVASIVLAALLVPILNLFSSTTGSAGQDVRKFEASNLAIEVMEQIVNLHKRLGKLFPLPGPQHPMSEDGELDLDAYSTRFLNEEGVPLIVDQSRCAWNSRLFLTPPKFGFRRYLKIKDLEEATDSPNFLPDALQQATVRVEYVTPLAGRDVIRDVTLTSCFFRKCRTHPKFRPVE